MYHGKKNFQKVFFFIVVCFLLFSPIFCEGNEDENEDEYEFSEKFERQNGRTISLSVDNTELELQSSRDTEFFSDEIELEVYVQETRGLVFDLEYITDTPDVNIDLSLSFSLSRLVEYRDEDDDGIFDASKDTVFQEIILDQFSTFYVFDLSDNNEEKVYMVQIQTIDEVFTLNLYISESYIEINNSLITPVAFKMDYLITNFPFIEENSRLALVTEWEEIDQDIDFHEEERIKNYEKNFEGQDVLEPNFFFSWTNISQVDGIDEFVIFSPTGQVNNDLIEYAFNYKQGKTIIHDPTLGIAGIEIDPAFLPDISQINHLFLIIIVVLTVVLTVVMTTQKYREYLLNRVLNINNAPHKLKMEDVLENKNRIEIIDLILKEPGIHFNKLLDQLDIASGTLVWHLDILETYKVIKKENVANYIVYYPYIWQKPFSHIEIMFNKNKTTLEVYQLVYDMPGIFQHQIAKALELSRKTAAYHLKKLIQADLIYSRKIGRKHHYFPLE